MGPKHDTSGTVQRLIALTLRPVSAWETGRQSRCDSRRVGGRRKRPPARSLPNSGSCLRSRRHGTSPSHCPLANRSRTDRVGTGGAIDRTDSPADQRWACWAGSGSARRSETPIRASFVLLPIRNVKRTGFSRGETAMNLHGSIWLERADGTKLDGPRPVRWQEKQEQIARTGPPTAAEVAEIDIPPNGRPCIADAILQDRSESGIRIWSQDGLRHPLIQESCEVVVKLEGSNMGPKTFSFRVDPGPVGSPPSIRFA